MVDSAPIKPETMMQTTADTANTRFWDRAAAKYAAGPIADTAGYERTLDRVRGLLSPTDRVLELGCGTGTSALRLAPGVADYLATDLSPEMITIARQKLAADPVPGLVFQTGTAGRLRAGGAEFDAVLGFNYLHLVRDWRGALADIRTLLRPGGLFISKTPCLAEMTPLIRLLLPLMRAVGKAPSVAVFSGDDLALALTAAGFTCTATERHGSKRKDPRAFVVARRD